MDECAGRVQDLIGHDVEPVGVLSDGECRASGEGVLANKPLENCPGGTGRLHVRWSVNECYRVTFRDQYPGSNFLFRLRRFRDLLGHIFNIGLIDIAGILVGDRGSGLFSDDLLLMRLGGIGRRKEL